MNKILTYTIIILIIILASLFVASPQITNNQIIFKRPLTGISFFITIVIALIEDNNLFK